MNSYLKILGFADNSRKTMIYSTAVLFLSTICGMIPFIVFADISRKLILNEAANMTYILSNVILIGVFLILKNVFVSIGLDLSHKAAYETLMKLRNLISEKILKISMGDIEKQGRGSIKKMFVESVEEMEIILAHQIPEGLSNIAAVLSCIIALLVIDFRIGFLVILNLILGFIAMFSMISMGMTKMSEYYKSSRYMNETLIDYVNGIEVVKVFNQTTKSFKKYHDAVMHYKNYAVDWTVDSLRTMSIYYVIFTTPLLWVLPFGGFFYLKGSITLSNLILVSLLSISMGAPSLRIVNFIPLLPVLAEKSRSILTFLESKELKDSQNNINIENFDVKFENVSFKYDESSEKYAVENINFTSKQNTVTALVGHSGSGKSTITKLLIRFWDIKQGSIKIGDVNISDISINTLMNNISYVSQDNFLFNMSIRDNLLVGKSDASEGDMINALKSANIYDFVANLPNKLDTLCGLSGTKLSGGEIQRLAIARAILKNSPIIILDEATSSTDPENEEKIQEALNKLIKDKTVFVVAHRLSTITQSDNILVLKDGKIDSQGTHEYLIENSSEYKKLFDASNRSINWEIGGVKNA